VVQPEAVEAGIAGYWMGSGGGVQYRFLVAIQELLDQGILKEIDG
jgi:hypothetical protein